MASTTIYTPTFEELSKPEDLLGRIQDFDIFAGVEQEAIEWLIGKASYIHCRRGDALYTIGLPAENMDLIVEGSYNVEVNINGTVRRVVEDGHGQVIGLLPFSRMTENKVLLKATADLYVLRVHKGCFTELVVQSYQLAQNLVAAMTSRVRDFSDFKNLDEKMMSLGKLSAGLAHELNNPSAAIIRSADELQRQVNSSPETFKKALTMQVTPEMIDEISSLIFSRIKSSGQQVALSAMERMDRVEAVEDWLDDHALSLDGDAIEALVDSGFSDADLEQINHLSGRQTHHLDAFLHWIAKNIAIENLVAEIKDASARISELVGSIKSYTHMDRDSGRSAVDLVEGLQSTLVMLRHKLKTRNVQLAKEMAAGLPKVLAWPGQLNQVYTNLIDNAIDAAGEGGEIVVRAYQRGTQVCIEIEDNGPGVPEELQRKIFDPFFTTKDVGAGTGMGLDITQRILKNHGTNISLQSQPGKTVFSFCLAIAPES